MNKSITNIISFLAELKNNNNREWFTANKDRYLQARAYFEKIGEDLICEIAKVDDEIKHVQVKDCVFRIYRDIRFSHDKTPYKTHFGVFVAADGGRKSQRGGYYLHLDPAGSFFAMGVWCPDPKLLKMLRQSVYDNIDEFNEIRNNIQFKNIFDGFSEEEKLKTVPAGFPKDFPEAEFLKLKHYLINHDLTQKELDSTDFIKELGKIAETGYPLNRFLNYTVDEYNEIKSV